MTLATLNRPKDAGGVRPPTDDNTILEWVPLTKVFADPSYTRPLKSWQVAQIREGWDVGYVGAIYVSLRDDGRYALLDGHHRVAGARLEKVETLPARVYMDLTLEEEAQYYLHFAAVNRQTAMDRFRARLTAQEPAALAINEVLKSHGLKVANGHVRGGVSAIYAIDRVYEEHGAKTFALLIDLLSKSWGDDPRAYVTWVVEGMAAFLIRFEKQIDPKRLIERMHHVGIERLYQRALMIKTGLGTGSHRSSWGRALHECYNLRIKVGRLGAWPEVMVSDAGREALRTRKSRVTRGSRRFRDK